MTDFEFQTPEMVEMLKEMVETESPSHEKKAVDRMGMIILEECRNLGMEVIVHPNEDLGDLIEAKYNHGKGGILILAHMDTVFPLGTIRTMPFRIKGDKIFGPGVSDMKGGIVVTLTALSAYIKSKPKRPITILFTPDEEIGSNMSREMIEVSARESSLVLVMEPAMLDGSVKTWRKGVGEYTIKVRGRAAHAGGDHEAGRNAIEELANLVISIQKMTDYTKGTTLNVGVIRGGIASNVVPDEAIAEVDLRVMQPGEAERIDYQIRSLKPIILGTTVEVSGGLNRPPMPFDSKMKETFERIKKISSGIGIDLRPGGTGGASDANFVAPLHIPVMDGLGPVGGDYHSEREFIFKESLPERARLLTEIIRMW